MGKRKSKSEPAPKKKMNKLDTLFSCPFCNHGTSVECRMPVVSNKMFMESHNHYSVAHDGHKKLEGLVKNLLNIGFLLSMVISRLNKSFRLTDQQAMDKIKVKILRLLTANFIGPVILKIQDFNANRPPSSWLTSTTEESPISE